MTLRLVQNLLNIEAKLKRFWSGVDKKINEQVT